MNPIAISSLNNVQFQYIIQFELNYLNITSPWNSQNFRSAKNCRPRNTKSKSRSATSAWQEGWQNTGKQGLIKSSVQQSCFSSTICKANFDQKLPITDPRLTSRTSTSDHHLIKLMSVKAIRTMQKTWFENVYLCQWTM